MRRLSAGLAIAHAVVAAVLAVVLVCSATSLTGGRHVTAFVVGILVVAGVFVAGCAAALVAPRAGARTASAVASGGWALLLARAVVVDAERFVPLAATCAVVSVAWVGVAVAAQVRDVCARVGLAAGTP